MSLLIKVDKDSIATIDILTEIYSNNRDILIDLKGLRETTLLSFLKEEYISKFSFILTKISRLTYFIDRSSSYNSTRSYLSSIKNKISKEEYITLLNSLEKVLLLE
jgi:hypothetical protein